jgi:hypothetical protein
LVITRGDAPEVLGLAQAGAAAEPTDRMAGQSLVPGVVDERGETREHQRPQVVLVDQRLARPGVEDSRFREPVVGRVAP